MNNTDNNINQEIPSIEVIADALRKLGYGNEQGLLDAATRLYWAPAVAKDMVDYVKGGIAPFDLQIGPYPQTFLRPLPDGFNIVILMKDFLLAPTGAFLMGAALITHYEQAIAMLEKMITDGVSIRKADGRVLNVDVPAASRYPDCSICGTKLVRKTPVCPECGNSINW